LPRNRAVAVIKAAPNKPTATMMGRRSRLTAEERHESENATLASLSTRIATETKFDRSSTTIRRPDDGYSDPKIA